MQGLTRRRIRQLLYWKQKKLLDLGQSVPTTNTISNWRRGKIPDDIIDECEDKLQEYSKWRGRHNKQGFLIIPPEAIVELKSKGMSFNEIGKELNISSSKAFRIFKKEIEGGN